MNVLLIDLSSICYPIWHMETANPDPNATSTKTVERVRALASGQPHVGVCVEGGRSFRKDLDPTYKANRPDSDAALQHQIALAIDILRADGFPILQAKGFEADDCIATACAKFAKINGPSESGFQAVTTIASADKDLLALVSDVVTVKSLKDGAMLDAAAVEAKFGVRPDQFLDFLSLVGDASDNIKGARNVGKVTAAELLKKYGTIEDMFATFGAVDNSANFTPALFKSLHEFKPRLESVRALLRLRTDAPIDIEPILRARVPLDVAEFGAIEEVMPSEPAVERTHDNGGPVMAVADVPSNAGTVSGNPVPSATVTHLMRQEEPTPVEWERQLEPRNMAQMKALATDLFASRLFSAYGHPAGVLSTILAGRELGLPAMAALRSFDIIEGKPEMKADLIRALVLRSGKVEYFRCSERDNDHATFVAKRNGDPEISLTFTIEDARRAWSKSPEAWEKSGYGKNPADMMVARAGAKLARLVAPDVVHGLYAAEEIE